MNEFDRRLAPSFVREIVENRNSGSRRFPDAGTDFQAVQGIDGHPGRLDDSTSVSDSTYRQHRRIVCRARDYVDNHFSQTIRISDLSEVSCASIKTLERSFKRVLGVTPRRYVTLLRLTHAHRMLREGRRSTVRVSDVAEKCGFRHHGRFSNEYRALYGEKPSETLDRSHAEGEPSANDPVSSFTWHTQSNLEHR